MNGKRFEELLEKRIDLIRNTLSTKQKEYATEVDRLHNFKRAAAMLGCTPKQALVGMWVKHIISILDIVDSGINSPLIEEKVGDAINYLILLEMLYKEVK